MRQLGLALAFLLAACGRDAAPPTTPGNDLGEEATPSADGLAVAVVVEVHPIWLGNDTYTDPSDPSYATGHHAAAKAAIETLLDAMPDGASTSIVTYGAGAELVPQLEGPEVYKDIFTRDLVAGVALARDHLRGERGRKALVIIGDGADTDAEADLRPLGDGLRADGIETYAIFVESELLEGRPDNLRKLAGDGVFDATDGDLGAAAARVAAKLYP